ncbi:hypothetical protein PsYK624_074970 [Phanerochaete sordida]|uniref:TM7S3/TM198-like domain-containing protein n=1 Tax=Phanerochaete sordida TaxID=48140 RepID=A0A9P3LEB9_9APHY|nr:hypothetical protein PsYK624_074970 [Phanerochaete sordida]
MLPRSPSCTRALALCLLLAASAAHASPVLARRGPVITYDDTGHIVNITDPTTQQQIAQGAATDGAGAGFGVPAVVWLAWAFAVGVPLALAGFRLGRLTTGAALGCAATLAIWASFVNAVGADGISDLWLMILPLAAFGCAFVLGLFEFGRIAGLAVLGVLGGMSVGVRIVLFRAGLLVPHPYWANWVVTMVLAAVMLLLVIAKQRAGVTLSAAAVGTFLIALGADLVANKQAGMSMGLRYFFDRNSAHILWLQTRGWHPPVTTEVIMAVSLAATPLLAYAQHRLFKQPFKRPRRDSLASRLSVDDDDTTIADAPEPEKQALAKNVEPSEEASTPPTPAPDEPGSPKEDTPFRAKLGSLKRS